MVANFRYAVESQVDCRAFHQSTTVSEETKETIDLRLVQ